MVLKRCSRSRDRAAPPRGRAVRVLRTGFAIACVLWFARAAAIAPDIIRDLASDDGDARDLTLLEAWRNGNARHDATDRVLLVDGDAAVDAASGVAVTPVPTDLEE